MSVVVSEPKDHGAVTLKSLEQRRVLREDLLVKLVLTEHLA